MGILGAVILFSVFILLIYDGVKHLDDGRWGGWL